MRSMPVLLLLLAACASAVAACSSDDDPVAPKPSAKASFPLTVENCGRTVTFKESPARIVTAGPYAAGLVAAAGGADRIVARYNEFGAGLRGPAKAAEGAPILVSGHEVAVEKVISTGAQLHYSNPAINSIEGKLAEAGIQTLYASGYCSGVKGARGRSAEARQVGFNDVYDDIKMLGRLLDTQADAQRSLAALRDRVAKVGASTPKENGARTALQLQVYDGVIYVFGKASMENAQLAALGLENVVADVEKEGFEMSTEVLIKRSPDIVILQYNFDDGNGTVKSADSARKEFLALPGAARLPAVKTGAIITVPYEETAPDPVAIDGVERIAKELAALR